MRRQSTSLTQPDTVVTVIEGPDILCQDCPLLKYGKCASPRGDEAEVRMWDAILLKELGITIDTCLTAAEWQKFIEQKAPFRLCGKCQYKIVCKVGQKSQIKDKQPE